MSSSRQRKSTGGRASKAQKQPNIFDSLKKVERRSSAAFDDGSAVVDLDKDDPYQFVGSQSLLPPDDRPTAPMDVVSTSSASTSRTSAVKERVKETVRIEAVTGSMSTPKQKRLSSGSVDSASKRKETPKSQKAATHDEWSEEEMELAIQASILEKQREDRRQRKKQREERAEEEEQFRLFEECQSMAGRRSDGGNGEKMDVGDDKVEDMHGHEPARPFSIESSFQPAASLSDTDLPSPIPTASLATGSQLKSVSVKKLSVKSLHMKRDKKRDSNSVEVVMDEAVTPPEEDGCGRVDEEPLYTVNGGCSSSTASMIKSRSFVGQSASSVEKHGSDREIVPEYDLDSTPPISEQGLETPAATENRSGGGQPVAVKPLTRQGDKTVRTEELKGDHGNKKQSPAANNGKPKSSKTGLSLKKSRKRLSDTDAGCFEEVPSSSSIQAPVAKRPRTQNIDKAASLMNVEENRQDIDGRGLDEEVDGSRRGSKSAIVSLTDVKKTSKVPKSHDTTTKKRSNIGSLSRPKPAAESVEVVELCEEDTKAAPGSTKMEDSFQKADRLTSQQWRNFLTRASTTNPFISLPRNSSGYLIKRQAPGWPLVRIKPSEIPNAPSLQAPPGVSYKEHAKVLVRCFDEYFAKLAMAQSGVLWRVKWGKPVTEMSKVSANSLSAGRRTKRSRGAVNVPYSEYALELKGTGASSSERKAASPKSSTRTSRRSLSKSPATCASVLLTASDSDSDFQPPTSSEKRKAQKKQTGLSRKKLNFSNVTSGEVTPGKDSRGSTSKLSLGRKSTTEQQGDWMEKSVSPSVQFDREESPDIIPPRQPERTAEPGSTLAAAAACFPASPATPPHQRQSSLGTTTTAHQDPEDDVMMLDLTSPSPPPSPAPTGQGGVAGSGREISPDNDGNQDALMFDDYLGRHSDESANEQGVTPSRAAASASKSPTDLDSSVGAKNKSNPLPPSRTTPSTTSSRSLTFPNTDDSTDEEGSPHCQTTSGALSSGGWLDARKPPPPPPSKQKPKRQTKKQATGDQSKNKKTKTSGGAGGRGKGKKSTKKPVSASVRMKALIQMSDTESEHSSLERDQDEPASSDDEVRLSVSTRTAKSKSTEQKEAAGLSDSDEYGTGSEEDREMSATPVMVSQKDNARSAVKERRTSSHRKESVIDLTAESQPPPPNHTSRCQLSSRVNDDSVQCPLCGLSFDASVIEIHAEQCEGLDSDGQPREELSHFTTESASKKKKTSAAGRGGGRGMTLKRGGRGKGRGNRKSYQPSLVQLVSKDKEVTGEDDIDSGSSEDDFGPEPALQRDSFSAIATLSTDRNRNHDDDDSNLEWNEEKETSPAAVGSGRHDWEGDYGDLPDDGPGGFLLDSEVQPPEAMPIEDGEGGYFIDPSMVSNSPIRSFKRLSDLDPQERAGFDNQFNSKRSRGRRGQPRGRPLTNEERQSTTWGRDDFSDLFDSGRSKRGRGRGGYGGKRPFKYDWKKARNRGGRGRSRGRRF